MECATAVNAAFYHPRNPRESPLFRLLEEHYEEFERIYPERYQQRYGPWRPAVGRAVTDFLKCGDLREGFARVHCPKCGHDLFVALSCRKRCLSTGRFEPLTEAPAGVFVKVIAFIERRDQAATVDLPAVPAPTALPQALQAGKILRHCGLWTDPPPSRAPHAILYTPPVQLDLLYVAEDAEPYDDARYDASG